MADAKLAGMRTRVRLERAGFQTLHADLFRNENLEPGPLMLGIPSLGLTWFWVLGYAPEHGYLMTPASIPATHPATTPPPDL